MSLLVPILPRPGTIRTSSRLRMWWLTRMRGYRLERSCQVPHLGWFGNVRYTRECILSASEKRAA